MSKKMEKILVLLLLFGLAALGYSGAFGHYTLVLFGSLVIPEFIFDIICVVVGTMFGIGGIMVLKGNPE